MAARRRRALVLLSGVVAAVAAVSIGTSGAYFTGATTAAGGSPVTGGGYAGSTASLEPVTVTAVKAAASGQTSGTQSRIDWSNAADLNWAKDSGTASADLRYTVKRSVTNDFSPAANPLTLDPGTGRSVTDMVGGTPLAADKAVDTDGGIERSTNYGVIGGKLYYWGQVYAGSGSPVSVATEITGITSEVVKVAGGFGSMCALTATSEVWCAGYNDVGQHGNGTTTNAWPAADKITSTGVFANKTIIDIGVGKEFACAITSDGTVGCWGRNQFGQLGYGTSVANQLAPVKVGTASGADWPALSSYKPTQLAVGAYHVCVLKGTAPSAAEKVSCWGNNAYQQAGVPATTRAVNTAAYQEPVNVPDSNGVLANASRIVAGPNVTCVLNDKTSTANVACWGEGTYGVLGNGASANRFTPTTITDASTVQTGFTGLAIGNYHACAYKSNTFVCWGRNYDGQLGRGFESPTEPGLSTLYTPDGVLRTVDNLDGDQIVSMGASQHSTCAVGARGGLSCFGNDFENDLGDGTGADNGTAGKTNSTVVKRSVVNGSNVDTPLRPAFGALLAENAGNEFMIAKIGNQYYNWGRTPLGSGGFTSVLKEVTGLPADIKKLASGYAHACGITNTAVYCVGDNNFGELGKGDTTNPSSYAATLVNTSTVFGSGASAKKLIDVAATDESVCVLAEDGTVACWGANDAGQVGPAATGASISSPQLMQNADGTAIANISAGNRLVSLSASWDSFCGPTLSKKIACWGSNGLGVTERGILGNSTVTTATSAAPVLVESGAAFDSGIRYLDGGRFTFCAVNGAGEAYCWGSGVYGHFGGGTDAGWSAAPQKVLIPSGVTLGAAGLTTITVGGNNACATTDTSNPVLCWGTNSAGQLGRDTTSSVREKPGFIDSTAAGKLFASGTVAGTSGAWDSTCILTTVGALSCWGTGGLGTLGQGGVAAATTEVNSNSPVPVAVQFRYKSTDTARPVSSLVPTCADGAVLLPGFKCSLVPNRTYYYEVTYKVDGVSGWTSRSGVGTRAG